MFHDIPKAVESRMRELEGLDAEQRRQGLPAIERLCSITPDTGKFLALLAVSAPPGAFGEVAERERAVLGIAGSNAGGQA